MAWKYSEQTTPGASANTVTASLPPHYSGLLLLALMSNDVGTSAITAPAGWTAIGVQANIGGCRGAAFYKFATSSSEPDPTFTGSTGTWAVSVSAWADVDAVTPIDATPVRQDWNNVQYASSAAYSTATDNATVIYLWNSDGAQAMTHPIEDITYLAKDKDNGSTVMTAGYRNVLTAGSAPTVRMLHTVATEGGSCLTFALRNAAGGKLGPCIAPGFCETIGHYFGTIGHTWQDPLSVVASINGITCEATSQTLSSTVVATDPWGVYNGWTSSTANVWAGGVHDTGTTYDFTNKIFAISWTLSANRTNASLGADGAIVVFFDSSGNYVAYQLRAKTYMALANVGYVNHIAPGVSTPYASAGTIDWTQIAKIGYMYHRVGAIAYILRVKGAMLHPRTATFHCGSDVAPITAVDYANQWTKWGYEGRAINPAGSGQVIDRQPIGIGNGSTDIYLNLSAQSVETPLPYSTTAQRVDYDVPADASGYTVNLTAGSKAYLKNCILVANTRQFFNIDAACSTSADLQLSNSTLRGFSVSWKSGLAAASAAFDACPTLDLKGGYWDSMTITGGSGTQAVLVDSGAKLTSCRFIRGSETYAITARQAGTLDLTSATFSGYTTVLNITAAVGTLTIKLALGQAQPTYTSAGATVVWDQPVVSATASVTGMVAGSRLRIYNVTTATEKVNAVQAGTSYSLSYGNGTEYTAGDVVNVRVCAPVGSTTYREVEYVAVATTGGWSVLVSQPADEVYNEAGIDGTTVTEFSADYPNIEVDIDDVDGTTTVQRLYAWWMANLFTEDGIRDFFGGMIAEDAVNFKIITSIVNIKLDNVNPTPLLLIGGRLYRSDGATVIASTSGPLHIDPQKAYAVETGISGLTPEQEAQLANLDVAVSTRLAAASYTAPDNASVSAIKAKTDNLPADPASASDIPTVAYADIRYVNGVEVKGTGTEADPWNPA